MCYGNIYNHLQYNKEYSNTFLIISYNILYYTYLANGNININNSYSILYVFHIPIKNRRSKIYVIDIL